MEFVLLVILIFSEFTLASLVWSATRDERNISPELLEEKLCKRGFIK